MAYENKKAGIFGVEILMRSLGFGYVVLFGSEFSVNLYVWFML